MTAGVAEIYGGSEEEIQLEREFTGDSLPGFGMAAEENREFEHRLCRKCQKMELRHPLL